jgi:hypothetical protein
MNNEDKYIDPNNRWGSTETKLKWTKSGSVWYISQAEHILQPGKRNHISFTVKDFTPNVNVSDDDFTLDGMNIPDGTMVTDSIAHKVYPYKKSP